MAITVEYVKEGKEKEKRERKKSSGASETGRCNTDTSRHPGGSQRGVQSPATTGKAFLSFSRLHVSLLPLD